MCSQKFEHPMSTPHCFSLPLILLVTHMQNMQMNTQSYATPDPGFKWCWAYGARATRNPYQEKRASLLSTPAPLYTVHSIDPLAVYWQIAYPPSPCGAGTNAAPKVSHFVVLKTNHIPRGVFNSEQCGFQI